MDSLGYDPQRFAMEYHIIGFRECAAEVARYLVTIEGMDIQDPLRLRLMSHLQYFVQQREMSKGCPVSPGAATWATHPAASTAAAAAAAYQPNCGVAPYQTYPSTSTSHASVSSSYVPNLPSALHQYPNLSSSPNAAASLHSQQQQQQQHAMPQQQQHSVRSTSVGSAQDTMPLMNHNTAQQVPTQQVTNQQQQQQQQQTQTQNQQQQQVTHPQHTPTSHETHQQQQPQQQQQQSQTNSHHAAYNQNHTQDHTQHQGGSTYIELTTAQTHNPHRQTTPVQSVPSSNLGYTTMPPQYPVSVGQEYNHQTGVYVTANGSKPYRPWGAEMAY